MVPPRSVAIDSLACRLARNRATTPPNVCRSAAVCARPLEVVFANLRISTGREPGPLVHFVQVSAVKQLGPGCPLRVQVGAADCPERSIQGWSLRTCGTPGEPAARARRYQFYRSHSFYRR